MDTNTKSSSGEGSFDLGRVYYCTRCQRDVPNPCIHDAEAIRKKCIPDPNKPKRFSLCNVKLLLMALGNRVVHLVTAN